MPFFPKNLKFLRSITKNELEKAVAFGMIPGASVVDAFGENPNITVADVSGAKSVDVWEGERQYPYDAFGSAQVQRVVSTNTGDTQLLTVLGLDINGYETEQTVTLNGTTPVVLSTPLYIVHKMINPSAVGNDYLGTIYAFIGTTTPTTNRDPQIRCLISPGNNESEMALYTIPRGKVGFLYLGEFGLTYSGTVGAGTNVAKVGYRSAREGKVLTTKKKLSLVSSGNTIYQNKRTFPDVIPSLVDIRLTVFNVTETLGVWGAFDILLLDEDKFDPNYLKAIGQYGY